MTFDQALELDLVLGKGCLFAVESGIKRWWENDAGLTNYVPFHSQAPSDNWKPNSVHFHLYLVSVLLSECDEWSAAPISAYLRRGPRGYFRSECCTSGESVTAPRVNRSVHSTLNTEHEAGQATSTVFMSSVWPDRGSNQAYQLWCRIARRRDEQLKLIGRFLQRQIIKDWSVALLKWNVSWFLTQKRLRKNSFFFKKAQPTCFKKNVFCFF